MAADWAKLSQDLANMAEENATLKAQVAHLESEEHSQEVILHWFNQDFQDVDPVIKVELGKKLGLAEMFEKAEVENTTSAGSEPEKEKPKTDLVVIAEALAEV